MATCPTCLATYSGDVAACPADGTSLVPDDAVSGAGGSAWASQASPPDPLAAALELEAGRIVGEYRIERKIGEGGFGAVYAAVHPVIGKSAAIKVLNPQYSHNPVMVSRFVAEARAVNQIRHRGIIDIFSFGKLEDGRQYYIMELLEGMTLEGYLRQRGRLRPSEALPILRQIARALDAAHAAGIAHRDLKPENVYLVFDEDGSVFPKLLDFGIAKLLGESQGHKTRTGTPMGTPLYMSPEQCRGKQVDHRTDIYSFGVMTHAVLTGQPPFMGDDVMDVLMQQVQTPPPAMSAVCPDVPTALDAPVLRMLAKDPAERPASVTAAIDAVVDAARAAGIEVPSVATRSSEKLPRLDVPAGLTPAQQAVFGQATTMMQPDVAPATTGSSGDQPKATLRSTPDALPSRRTKVLVMALGAGLLVAGTVAATLHFSRGGQDAVAAHPPPPPPPPPPALAPVKTAAPEPTVEPVVPLEIELRVQATPDNVEVHLGERKLGVAPGPFKIPHGDAPVELTFSAKGHQSKTVSVEPNHNILIPITLEKEKATSQPRPSGTAKTVKNRGELEY
ncbi:serine/threonine-protein kinase [Polyangium sp. y55x31]|uniref:serine/threonine-protein kinase n=1 Tax=Polyangium sp. y55x31 TaxID=3042688 RepID=UPI0024827FFB|nr:serine/threonine-protein kinase [Polyangium sp. y55x31]MDI1480800.1 serine/threonine-protein kinase [Polyangium sp. y55x31]